jgi:iron complex outermembrane receptor protein
VLNLRNFGTQRTLVLLDGHRVTPANANGTVNVDSLPAMLVERVDVVTGGASSVYGSDAVTGVVNYILNKKFSGLKLSASAGVSSESDAENYTVGLAAGTALLDGRAHFEFSLRRFDQAGVLTKQRQLGREDWGLLGLGTAASPFNDFIYTGDTKAGGRITCTGCTANRLRLDGPNIVPYNEGIATGTVNFTSMGDGGHTSNSQMTAGVTSNESFGRLSFDLNDKTTLYVQGMANEAYTRSAFQDHVFTTGITGTFLTSNPLIPAHLRPMFANPSGQFGLSFYFHQGYPRAGNQTNTRNRNVSFTTGMDGVFADRFDWDVFYTHGQNELYVEATNNQNHQRMFAGEDAVIAPSGPDAGKIVCYVTTTQYADRYKGCVPVNPFIKANYVNEDFNQWIGDTTYFTQTTTLDNAGGSIAGDIFGLPAGQIRGALSAEARWQSFEVVSNADPTVTVDCTGLRICNPATALYHNNVVATLPEKSLSVWELAAETTVPLLKDLPLVRDLSVNLAGRYTDYSTSGPVKTWKIGFAWLLDDNIRLRGTSSLDIRAPTLNDLYSPISRGATSYADRLTSFSGQLQTQSQGNPNLTPEEARTYTVGVVLTPTFLPGFTASVDYYTIVLKNALSSVNGTADAVQKICIDSNGTSPFCGLYVRPIAWGQPGYNTAANFPTFVLSQLLNTAFNKVEGTDVEASYTFDLASLSASLPGVMNLRMLGNYQPINETLQYDGAPLTWLPFNKGRITAFGTYKLDTWSFGLSGRWYSSYKRASLPTQVYVNPRVEERTYFDLNIDKKFTVGKTQFNGYLSIENLFDVDPPIAPTIGIVPGLFYIGNAPKQYDFIGRYFTLGVRAQF